MASCEFFVDIDNEEFGDYLYFDSYLRSDKPGYALLGTTYLGSRSSARSYTCYDKRRELLQRAKKDIGHPRLRIEAQLRGLKSFAFKNIAEVTNPFANLMVVSLAKLQITTCAVCQEFHSIYLACGSAQVAFSQLSSSKKFAMRQALAAAQPGWWVPAEIWKAYPSSLGWVSEFQCASGFGEMWLPGN